MMRRSLKPSGQLSISKNLAFNRPLPFFLSSFQTKTHFKMPALSQTGVSSDKELKSGGGSQSGGSFSAGGARRGSRSSQTLQGNRRGSGIEKLDNHVGKQAQKALFSKLGIVRLAVKWWKVSA